MFQLNRNSAVRLRAQCVHVVVLNAFRHHRLLRSRRARLSPRCRTRCAQRLSASQIIALDIGVSPAVRLHMCSTPFGITDYCA